MKTMKSLKEQILAAQKRKLEAVFVPEWGFTVYVPLITLGEVEQVQATSGDATKLAAFIIRNELGDRVFTDDEADALKSTSFMVFKRIVDAYDTLNGNGEDAGKN